MNNLSSQWRSIVKSNVSRINNIPLQDCQPLVESIIFYVNSIFDILIKLKNQSFYNKKEIETIFLLTKRDITNLNDCLSLTIEEDRHTIIPLLIYYIIDDIFVDLIELMEYEEAYEGAKNLLDFKSFWFNLMSIKPNRVNVK